MDTIISLELLKSCEIKRSDDFVTADAVWAELKLMSVTFDKAEAPFKVKCDVHPWMGAFLGVFDHPYFAVTDDSGSYTISGLAPGKYVIEAWHEKLGSQIADITVDDSGASQDFTFKKPSKKK